MIYVLAVRLERCARFDGYGLHGHASDPMGPLRQLFLALGVATRARTPTLGPVVGITSRRWRTGPLAVGAGARRYTGQQREC